MEKSQKNASTNKHSFLKDKLPIENIDKNHEDLLGFQVPEGYFSESNKAIFEKVTAKKGIVVKLATIKLRFMLPIAAAVALVLTLTVFKPNSLPTFENIPSIVSDTINEFKNNELATGNIINLTNDITIASLFVEDSEIDELVDNYVIDMIITEEMNVN